MKSKTVLIIGIVMILMLFQFSILTSNVNAEVITGGAGESGWSFDTETGTLTFPGTAKVSTNWASQIAREDIKHIKFEEGIETTGESISLFLNLVNLEDVEFPASLKQIGYGCFSNCVKLEQITLPKNLESLTFAAFSGCKSLKTITLPKTLVNSGANSFAGCTSLTEVLVEQGNENYISENGILYTKDKTRLVTYPIGKTDKEFDVPSSVTVLGWASFADSENLEKIVVPNTVTELDEAVFQDCKKLKIYCKSDSEVKKYAEYRELDCVIDDDAPIVDVEQKDNDIVVTATDSGVGLCKNAYSLDKENWSESSKFAIEKSGTYTVYVQDRLGNIGSKEVVVTIVDKKEDEQKTTDEKNNEENNEENKGENGTENKGINEKNGDNQKDDTVADKEFGQFGSSKTAIISLIAAASVLMYLSYKKIKQSIIK